MLDALGGTARLAPVPVSLRAPVTGGSGAVEPLQRLARMARTLVRAPYAAVTVDEQTGGGATGRISDPVYSEAYSQASDAGLFGAGISPAGSGPLSWRAEHAPGGAVRAFCRQVVSTGQRLVLGDVRQDPRSWDDPGILAQGIVAWAGLPVCSPDGQPLGTLWVHDTTVRVWTPADLSLLSDLATIAGRELSMQASAARAEEAARLAETTVATARRAQARAHLLSRAGELLTVGLDLPAVWRAVVRLAVPELADYAFVHTVTREGIAGHFLLHRDPARQAEAEVMVTAFPRRLTDRSGPGLVASTGETQLVPAIDDVLESLSPEQRIAVARLGATSSISIPLRVRDTVLGVLTVVRVHGSPPYTTEDVQLVESLAARAALVLDNSLAYERERHASLRLQEALLPSLLPQREDVELAARYLPAGREQMVGGDWYDAFIDLRGRTTLVIGDVAGHDLGAAAAMGQLRAMIRMAGHAGRLSPAGLLNAVDTATDDLGTSVFATAVVVHVEPAGNGHPPGALDLVWSSAGHPAPVLVEAGGEAQLIVRTPDRPLGLDLRGQRPRRQARQDHRCTLLPGGSLVLYTDGLVEGRGHDLDSGTRRLLHAATALQAHPLDAYCSALLARMDPDGTDDVALLALRSSGPTG